MRNCSFASVDKCHQLTFCKKKGLRNVEEEEKTLLGLRSKLPETDIEIICCHHEQSLLVKFSAHIRRCADPFTLHSKGLVTKALYTVTLDFYSKTTSLKGIIAPGEKLCISCKKQAVIRSKQNLMVNESRDADVAEAPVADIDTIVAGSSRSCTKVDSTTSISTKSDIEHLASTETSQHDTNAVLQILGETPVKTSKC